MKRLRKHGFILALLGAVLLAWAFPGLGASDGWLKADLLARVGVMVIFFLQGLTLRTRELAGGLRSIRLHAFVQGWIFLGSAVIHGLVALVLHQAGQPELASGFLYLALLPTTITSAILFTSAGGGNVPAAIFNTTFSNVLGVFWVPLGCVFFFAASGGSNGLPAGMVGALLLKIARLILLPLLAGQLVRPFLWKWPAFKAVASRFKYVNHTIIVFIVFSTFSQSFLSNSWAGIGAGTIILLLVLASAAVILIHLIVWTSSSWVTGIQSDRTMALFCASQKTLAAGAPMAVAIFSTGSGLGQVSLGLLLLPLLCYHPLQLFLAAFILPRISD